MFDNIYPAIVPKEVYEKVRQKTDTNKYGKRSVEVVYMLRNKMICGYCGKPISAETGTSKAVKRYGIINVSEESIITAVLSQW